MVRAGVGVVLWAGLVEAAGAGEENRFVVLVEGKRHDAVGGPERLFDAVAMVDVDVDVEDARIRAQHLEDGEDDVVDVAESAGFALFGMVQPAGPIDGDIGLAGCQFASCVEGGASVVGAVVEEAVENGTVVAHVEGVVALAVLLVRIRWLDCSEEFNVFLFVEGGQFRFGCLPRNVKIHGFV